MTILAPRFPGQHVITLLRNPLPLIEKMAALPDDVVGVRLGHSRLYLMNGPGPARALLTHTGDGLRKERALRLARIVFGNGLLTSEGELHRRQRRLLQPAFETRRMPGYARTFCAQARALGGRWEDGRVVDVGSEMTRLTLSAVARALCGVRLPDADGFLAAAAEGRRQFTRYRNPLAEVFERLPLPSTLRLRRARRTLRDTAARILAAEPTDREPPVLAILRGCEDREQAIDELVTLLLAGHDTTEVALTWAWVLLARHPEAEARLHEELRTVLGDRPPQYEDLPTLEYTGGVIREAMRLFPPVWAVSREATREIELANHTFAAGSVLMVSQYALNRDPRFWPEPSRFDPARFVGGDPVPPFVYVPFSRGHRGCIGERFASTELTLVLATLAGGWRFRLTSERPIPLRPGITLEPGRPVLMRLEKRRTPA